MTNPYVLGVDLGTTFTAAAIGRVHAVEALTLGANATASIPSVVLFRQPADGEPTEILVGDAAERRAQTEPTRAAREFKRRLGDPVPLVVAGEPHTPEELMTYLLAEVLRVAAEHEGAPPSRVVLTHPANYADHKLGLLRGVAHAAGLTDDQIELLTEPEAAAVSYARGQRIDDGEVIAVYDFGGGTFDAAVVRRAAGAFELLGVPEGMERLGGIDFDHAVLAHVDASTGGLVSSADRSDPAVLPAQARLRADCARAKEALSTDTDTSIPIGLPGLQHEVRLTRDELEAMVRPRVAETVRALERTVASAGLTFADIARVLLVGGTSRMPLVGQLVREATGRPVAVDAHPKLTIAVGAAAYGAASLPAAPSPVQAEAAAPAEPLVVRKTPPPAQPTPPSRRKWPFVVGGVAVGAAAVAAVLALGGGDDGGDTASTPSTTVALTSPDAPGRSDVSAETIPPVTAPADGVALVESVTDPAVPLDIAALTSGAGRVYAALADGPVLELTVNGPAPVARIDDAAAIGGAAVTPDGAVWVSSPAGLHRCASGTCELVTDAAVAGLGPTPGPLAADGAGSVYVADNSLQRIVRRGSDGGLSMVAGGPTAPLGQVAGMVVATDGRLLFTDATAGQLRAVAVDGTVSTVTDVASLGLRGVGGVAVEPDGTIYVSDPVSATVVRFGADGSAVPVPGLTAGGRGAVTLDLLAAVYADTGGTVVRTTG